MNKLVESIALGALRTVAAGAVPTLIHAGVLQANQTNDFIGATLFFGALAFSALDKFVVHRKIEVAAATGNPAPSAMTPMPGPTMSRDRKSP